MMAPNNEGNQNTRRLDLSLMPLSKAPSATSYSNHSSKVRKKKKFEQYVLLVAVFARKNLTDCV